MTIREGKWKCPGCDAIVRGALPACSSCGRTRDDHVAFCLDEDAPAVEDAAQLARAAEGADWICNACDNACLAHMMACPSCGAPRTMRTKKHGAVLSVDGGPTPSSTPAKKGGWRDWI